MNSKISIRTFAGRNSAARASAARGLYVYDPLTLARARVLCEPFQLRFRTDAHQEEPHKAPLLLMSVARGWRTASGAAQASVYRRMRPYMACVVDAVAALASVACPNSGHKPQWNVTKCSGGICSGLARLRDMTGTPRG